MLVSFKACTRFQYLLINITQRSAKAETSVKCLSPKITVPELFPTSVKPIKYSEKLSIECTSGSFRYRNLKIPQRGRQSGR